MAMIIQTMAVVDGPMLAAERQDYIEKLRAVILELNDDIKESSVEIRIMSEEAFAQHEADQFNRQLAASEFEVNVIIHNPDVHDDEEVFETTLTENVAIGGDE